MKKIIKNLISPAVLLVAVSAVFAATAYETCRCGQATPGIDLNTCCAVKVGASTVWTGGSAAWSISYCKTPCPTSCPSGQIRNLLINYSEDGACCKLGAPVGGGGGTTPTPTYTWTLSAQDIFCFKGSSVLSQNGILVYSPGCNDSAILGTACNVQGGTGYCEYNNWNLTALNCCDQQTSGSNMTIPITYGCGHRYTCQ